MWKSLSRVQLFVTPWTIEFPDFSRPEYFPFSREGHLSLLQGILPTQGSNPGLQHCRWIPYQQSYQGSPEYDGKIAPYTNTYNSGICPVSVVPNDCNQEMGSRCFIHKRCVKQHIEHTPIDVGFKWWINFCQQSMDFPAWGKLSSWYKSQKEMFQGIFHMGAVLVTKKRED